MEASSWSWICRNKEKAMGSQYWYPSLCCWVLDCLLSAQVVNSEFWLVRIKRPRMWGRKRREKTVRNPPQEGGSKYQDRMEIGGKFSQLWFSWSKEKVDIFYVTVCCMFLPSPATCCNLSTMRHSQLYVYEYIHTHIYIYSCARMCVYIYINTWALIYRFWGNLGNAINIPKWNIN